MKKSLINSNHAIISNNQTAKIAEPRDSASNFPSFAIAPQFSAILKLVLFSMGANKLYFELLNAI